MFDAQLRPIIDPPMRVIGKSCIALGLQANHLTLIGFSFGLLAAIFIIRGHFYIAFICFLLNRVADGLDGAVARLTKPTDVGGFLDVVADFLFYALIPFAFGVAFPEMRLAALYLIFSFVGTGCSFLAYAIIAAKRDMSTDIRGKKSFYYLGGLTEGGETIVALGLVILWPSLFVPVAIIFGTLCWITTATRIWAGWRNFQE